MPCHASPQLGVGVRGAADIVRPVVHGGDAGIDRLCRAPCARRDSCRRAYTSCPSREVTGKYPTCGFSARTKRPQATGPQVPMRLDEPGHADHAATVDHFGARRRQARGHRDDRAVAHMHVAARNLAEAGSMVSTWRRAPRTRRAPGAKTRGRRAAPCPMVRRGVTLAAASTAAPATTVRRLTLLFRMIDSSPLLVLA